MAAPRKFDWDEARRLRASGLTYAEIGRRLGVSSHSVNVSCDDESPREIEGMATERDMPRLWRAVNS